MSILAVRPDQAAAESARPEPEQPRGIPDDARKRFELLQDCRELVISRLSKVVHEALNKMSEDLSALAVRSRDAEEQRALMDAVSIVRQHRTEIELRFRRSFTDVFERRMFNQQVVSRAPAEEPGELALVDDAEMQAKLAVDRLVHRTRGTLDPDEVLGVRARLAALLERDWFDEGQHPAAPEAVFEALKSALAELAPKAEVQSALLDAFEPHVSANLNQVYNSVNERLKANRILPKIRPQVSLQPGQKRPGQGDGAPDTVTGPGAAQQAQGAAHGAAHGAAGALNSASGAPFVQEVQSILSQLSQGAPNARASATRMLSDPDIFAVADLPFPAVEPPLLDALSSVQVSSAASPGLPADLLAELAERTREKGSPLDQLTVEIVSMVFDYIYADKRLADVIKQQLLRLQVVAIKAALIDRSFFARRQHPMRRLIDRISEVAADPDADLATGSELVKGVESVVESVLQNFEQDLSIFDQARARIDELAAQEQTRCAERLARVTREAERREALSEGAELDIVRLADRIDSETPVFLRDFLNQWWSRVLSMAHLDGGGDAAAFDEAMATAEALIWSVAPKLPDEVGKLAAMLPKLIGAVMRGVRQVSVPEDVRERFFNELLQSHTRSIAAAKQAAATAAARRPTNVAMRSDGRIQFKRVNPPVADLPVVERQVQCQTVRLETLRRGESIELLAADGQWRAFKLSWVSPQQRLYVLSRFPDEARSLDRTQLAELFDRKEARLGESRSSVDQALEKINEEPQPA